MKGVLSQRQKFDYISSSAAEIRSSKPMGCEKPSYCKSPHSRGRKDRSVPPRFLFLKTLGLTNILVPLARSIWNWRSKKVWRLGLLFIQRWSLLSGTRRHQTLGKICTTWGIRTLYLRSPCDRGHKGKGLKPLFPQQELYQRLSKL